MKKAYLFEEYHPLFKEGELVKGVDGKPLRDMRASVALIVAVDKDKASEIYFQRTLSRNTRFFITEFDNVEEDHPDGECSPIDPLWKVVWRVLERQDSKRSDGKMSGKMGGKKTSRKSSGEQESYKLFAG